MKRIFDFDIATKNFCSSVNRAILFFVALLLKRMEKPQTIISSVVIYSKCICTKYMEDDVQPPTGCNQYIVTVLHHPVFSMQDYEPFLYPLIAFCFIIKRHSGSHSTRRKWIDAVCCTLWRFQRAINATSFLNSGIGPEAPSLKPNTKGKSSRTTVSRYFKATEENHSALRNHTITSF